MIDKSNGKGCIDCELEEGKTCEDCIRRGDIENESRTILSGKQDGK